MQVGIVGQLKGCGNIGKLTDRRRWNLEGHLRKISPLYHYAANLPRMSARSSVVLRASSETWV
jgi:hypothetical protein